MIWNEISNRIREVIFLALLKFSLIDREDFEEPPFRQKGGYDRINTQLDEQLDAVLRTIRKNLFAKQAG